MMTRAEIDAWDDLVVVSRELTPEDKKEISAAIKAHKEKEARLEKVRAMRQREVKTVKAVQTARPRV